MTYLEPLKITVLKRMLLLFLSKRSCLLSRTRKLLKIQGQWDDIKDGNENTPLPFLEIILD